MPRLARCLAAALIAVLPALQAPAGDLTFISLGAGEFGGGYYQTARVLCDRVNRIDRTRLRCSPEATSGSIYNIRALRTRNLDVAIVQSDWAANARAGTGVFAAAGPAPELMALGGLYVEAVTVLARRGSGIRGFGDLRGRRVDHGLPASGRRATMNLLLARFGMNDDDFAEVAELHAGAVVAALCEGRIDASVLVVGHPSALVQKAIAECGAELVPVIGPAVEALLADSPAYVRHDIPGDLYGADEVRSIGTTAVLMARSDSDPAVVERITRMLVADSRVLSQRAPLLHGFSAADLGAIGGIIPLHPAARAALGP